MIVKNWMHDLAKAEVFVSSGLTLGRQKILKWSLGRVFVCARLLDNICLANKYSQILGSCFLLM